jgi:uncharacterized membrane protein YdjX (TVP38/TMEM64 family)
LHSNSWDPSEPAASASRRAALGRLAVLALVVGGLFAWTVLAGERPSAERLRAEVDALGASAPLLYVGLSAALSCAWVPGPLLAGVAGVLFGTALGVPVSLAAASLAAVLQLEIARHVAGRPVREWLAPRTRRLDGLLESRGLVAVALLRLVPGVPYVATNYSAGLTTLRARDMGLGTALGAAPKTFAYVALGGTLGDLGRPEAQLAVAVLVVLAIGGVGLARRVLGRGPP